MINRTLRALRPGAVVTRVWGNGFLRTQVRVARVDDLFVYCDAQRNDESDPWQVLPQGSELWKFDLVYGVETDESQGWGIGEGTRNIVLSYIEPQQSRSAT